MENEIVKILVQLAVTMFAAFLGAQLALKRFKSEKWWERKATAYSDLVEALHNMRWPSSEHFEAGIEHRKIPDDYSEQLWQEFEKARKQVWKIAESSSFLISPKVFEVVQEMERGLSSARSAETWFEHLDTQGAAIDKCLNEIKKIGKKELSVEV